jgi:hypothetical protein
MAKANEESRAGPAEAFEGDEQGPITTGLPCCAKAGRKRLSKLATRRMGPDLRGAVHRACIRMIRWLAMTAEINRHANQRRAVRESANLSNPIKLMLPVQPLPQK